MKKAAVVMGITLLLAGCGKPREESKAVPQPAPVTVSVVKVDEKTWPSTYEATGTVRARTTAVISAKVMGYVREVKVQVGDHVRDGQPLVALDARDLDISAQHARAALDEVRSAIPEAESAIAAAKVNLDLAQTTFNRMQDLFSKKSISNQEFDEASAKVKGAQASYDLARAKRSQIDTQAARVQQEVQAAEVTRSYAAIAAPFAGVVTVKSADPGTLAVPGAPLLTIEQDGAYRLEAAVEESRMPAIKVGQVASVRLDGIERTLDARVSEIVPSVDAASRTFTVKIDLPALATLRSGMFGRAAFPLGSRKMLTIPAGAVVERGQLQSVFVVDNGTAHTRLITTGQRLGGQGSQAQFEALSGLNSGDAVIVPVPAGLTDGAPVVVRP